MSKLAFGLWWLHDCGVIEDGKSHELLILLVHIADGAQGKNAIAPKFGAMEVEWAILDSNQ